MRLPVSPFVGSAEPEVDAVDWLTEIRRAYDLVIVDVFLRSGSGLNVLRVGRALLSGSTLVVLTNYATPEINRVCTDLGAARVFDKSTQLEDLIEFCRQIAKAMQPPTLN